MGKFTNQLAEDVVRLNKIKAIGADFWLKTSVVGSIGTNATMFITQNSTMGELVIEDVIIKTSNGFGGGTTLRIICNNSKGTTVIFEEAVARLGSSKTVDMRQALMRQMSLRSGVSAAAQTTDFPNARTVLEEGKNLQIEGSGAFTGIGESDIYIRFKRVGEYADILLR